MKRLRSLAFPIVTAYLWVMMVLFGAIVLETFMVYPNVFADPPESLELTMDFLSVTVPHLRVQTSPTPPCRLAPALGARRSPGLAWHLLTPSRRGRPGTGACGGRVSENPRRQRPRRRC